MTSRVPPGRRSKASPPARDPAALEAELARLRRRLRAAEKARASDEKGLWALRDPLARLRRLHDLAPVGLIVTDANLVIQSVNVSACELLGRRERGLVGFPFVRCVHPGARRRVLAIARTLREGGGKDGAELEIVREDGALVPVQLICVAADDLGVGPGSLAIAAVDLSERRTAEGALRRQSGLLDSVMRTTDVMLVYLDAEFNFLWVNEAYARTCGFRPEDMVGKNHFALYPDPENEAIFRRVRATGEPAFYKDKPFEFPDQPERGTTYWDWSLAPVKAADGTVANLVFSLRETTQFLRAEEGLRQSEQRYRALVERSPDAVLIHRDGRIVFANPALLRLLGATDERQVIGRTPFDLFGPESHDAIRARIDRTAQGEIVGPREQKLIRLDGGERDVEVVPALIETHEGRAIQVILHDITARRAAERELEGALAQSRRREAERAALLGAARVALEMPAFDAASRSILATARTTVGAQAGFVAVCAADGAEITVVHADLPRAARKQRRGEAAPIAQLRENVAAARGAFVENAPPADGWLDLAPFGPTRLQSVLAVPVVIGGEMLGFLGLLNKAGGFTADDGKLASAFAEMAAVALLNSRTLALLRNNQAALERQVRERTTALEGANVRLDAERRRLYSLLEELPLFVYLRGDDHLIRFANRYFREHFGDPEGKSCYELMGAGTSPCSGCHAADVLATRTPADWEWVSPGGRSYQIHNYPFEDADGSLLVLEMGIDITELRQALGAERRARVVADALRAGTLALTRSLDSDAILAGMLEHLAELVAFDRARVMVLEGESRLTVRAALDADQESCLPPLDHAPFEVADNPVIREVVASGTAMMIADTHAHPLWGSRGDRTIARSWMGVPLLARGRVIGMFSMSKYEPGYFTPEHLRLAEAFSGQASLALENAMLFAEVQESQGELQKLSRRLVAIQEDERRAVARELHDEAGQSLASLLYGLRVIERESRDNAPIAARAGELVRTAESVLEDLHRLAADLRPASLDHVGLEAAIRQHVAVVEESAGLKLNFISRGLDRERLPGAIETALYRVAQEALANVARHAGATAVDVLLELRDGRVVLVVEDNGAGFAPEESRRPDQLGIVAMRERVEAVGGKLVVESGPSTGTTIAVEVPCAEPHPVS